MPNRVLQAQNFLDSISIKDIRAHKNEKLNLLLIEIENILKYLPVAKWNDNPMIVLKSKLYNKKRIIRLEIASRIGKTSFNEKIGMIQNNNCTYCGCSKKNQLQIDHIIPISKGGSDDIGNLQVLCFRCNYKKKDKIYAEQDIERLDRQFYNG